MGIPIVTLSNGVEMPAIGLGTWSGMTEEEHWSGMSWYLTAIKEGYKHFDTAYGYGTEAVLGEAIRKSGVPRDELFVTTKLPNHHHSCVKDSLEESLTRFGFDYFDLYLVHFPQALPAKPTEDECRRLDGTWETVEHPDINETWAQMEEVMKTGKVRAIGVANFSIKTLTQLFKTAKIIPAVNQVEMHPHLNQKTLKEFCDSKGIVMTAYSPTGYQPVREDPIVNEIARKHDVLPTQVTLAWHVQRGTTAIPKSTKVEHQRANLNLPTLSPQEMERLSDLDKGIHLCQYGCPPNHVFGWSYEQLGW